MNVITNMFSYIKKITLQTILNINNFFTPIQTDIYNTQQPNYIYI